ncbi:hypothetical protein B2A_13651, partial [mine drainage metagenome]
MEKGVEISFQLSGSAQSIDTVYALGNLTGNKYKDELEIDWRIFHVTLGNEKFYKVLFTGKKVGRLHHNADSTIRKYFDDLSKKDYNELMALYTTAKKVPGFVTRPINE